MQKNNKKPILGEIDNIKKGEKFFPFFMFFQLF